MKRLTSAILAGALALGAASTANATIVLTSGSGWQGFSFGGVGSTFSDDFKFTITAPTVFRITDAFLDGDQFSISGDGGIFSILTSAPVNDGTQVNADYDAAFASPKYSSLAILLGAGTYDITGKVVKSPFGSGGAAVSLGALATPEAGTWALMILGFGAIGGALRRRVKPSEVSYKMA